MSGVANHERAPEAWTPRERRLGGWLWVCSFLALAAGPMLASTAAFIAGLVGVSLLVALARVEHQLREAARSRDDRMGREGPWPAKP